MRKHILVALFCAFCTVGVANAYPDDPTYATWTDKSGKVTKQGNPVRVLKMVRLADNRDIGVSVVSGDALVYSLVSDDGVSVALTTTSADGALAGIAATAILTSDSLNTNSARDDAGRRNWGWIVVHGPADANVSAGGTNGNSAGDLFITSTDSGKITALQTGAASTAVTVALLDDVKGAGGFFMDAASGSATKTKVFVEQE
jgi:hypothetical protein